MQNNRWLQTLIVLLVIIAAAWLAGQVWSFIMQFANILLLFFLAWLLAFILSPIARAMQRRGMPKTLSVLVVYLGLGVLFTLAGWYLVPIIIQQVQGLIGQQQRFINTFNDLAQQATDFLHKNLGLNDADLTGMYNQIVGTVQNVAFSALQNTLSFLQSFATFALQFVLVLILSFYFMNDSDRIFGGMLQLLPPRWQDEARLVAMSVEKSFGGFIRGQLLFALIYAIGTAIVMVMPPFHLDFVIVASLVAGFCMIIPLIGNFLAFVPPILVALVTGKADLWIWLLIAEFVMQGLMMNLVGPRVMSSAIGIHPLYVVAAMLMGGQVAGLWGALFGIPVAGSINLIGRPVMRRLRYQTALYKEPEDPTLSTSAFLTGPLAASMSQINPNAGIAMRLQAGQEPPEVLTGAAQALKQPTGELGIHQPTGPTGRTGPTTQPPTSSTPSPGTPSGRLAPATQPHTLVLEEEDYMVPMSPTIAMRLWRGIFSLAGRAYDRARRRAARSNASR